MAEPRKHTVRMFRHSAHRTVRRNWSTRNPTQSEIGRFCLSGPFERCALSQPQQFTPTPDTTLLNAVVQHSFRFSPGITERLQPHMGSGTCETASTMDARRYHRFYNGVLRTPSVFPSTRAAKQSCKRERTKPCGDRRPLQHCRCSRPRHNRTLLACGAPALL